MMERHVTIPCPCTPDCPDRHALCFSVCKPYLEYDVRKKCKQAQNDAYAGIKKTTDRARRAKLAHGKRR